MRLARFPVSLTIVVTQLLIAAGCSTVPLDHPRNVSTALAASDTSGLSERVSNWSRHDANQSGFILLPSGGDALGVRLRLMQLAEESIDVQYFLMRDDTSGTVFSQALVDAADRGVRVRFLLDDIYSTIDDEHLARMSAHANIEVRLYNPVARRGIEFFNALGDFKNSNRRMHNKSLTVDNVVTIVGGRDIADEYFELQPKREYLDLDVFAFGPVATEVSSVFDLFWNHKRSVPIEVVAPNAANFEVAPVAPVPPDYTAAAGKDRVIRIFDGVEPYFSAAARVVTDAPMRERADSSSRSTGVGEQLLDAVGHAEEEVIVFTPYFVPGKTGVEFWKSIVEKGVRVALFTNSLASSNHPAAHAGYAKYRKKLIAAGVELFEVRVDKAPHGAPALMLHTKAIVIDRKTIFIGSLNLDPRSMTINSEMGVLICSEALGAVMADAALRQFDALAYRVELNDRRRLRWRVSTESGDNVIRSEPQASLWKRLQAFLLRIFPESQL